MNVQEALHAINLSSFTETLIAHHVSPEEQEKYVSFIDMLKARKPIFRNAIASVTMRKYEYDDPADNWEELEATVRFEGDDTEYAIDFIPWEECLGFDLNEKSVEEYGLHEVLFSLLYDMTFDGFDDSARQKNIDRLDERADETESDKSQRKAYNSLDELFDDLNL